MPVQLPNGGPCRISTEVEPAVDNREALVRFQHPAPVFVAGVTGRDGRCTRLLIETRLVRLQRHPPSFAGLADRDMHSPFKRDEVGSIPTSRTKVNIAKRRHSITDQCSELLPRTMRVQISLPLPMWGCGPTDEGARLRTLRSEFNSLHPLPSSRSRGLRHEDDSVLTKISELDSRRELQRGG